MEIIQVKSFKKDLRRCDKRGCSRKDLKNIIEKITNYSSELKKHRVHKWVGHFRGYSDIWELHIKPDWLLLYKIEKDTLILLGTGAHSDFMK